MNFLIGKTITNVDNVGVLDFYQDDTYVCEVYKITCSDGTEFYVSSDSGDVSDAYCDFFLLNDSQISSILKKTHFLKGKNYR